MMHADRTSRWVLGLLGLLLLAAGIAGLLAGTGVFGGTDDQDHLLANPIAEFIGDNSMWFWPVVALVCAIIAVLALLWLIAVLTPAPRTGTLLIPGDRSAGRTTLKSGALTDALTSEVAAYRGVHSARAWVDGAPTTPRLNLAIGIDENADLVMLRHRIETEALARARQALDSSDLPIHLEMSITAHRASRVS
jgi:MFS family permease